MKSKSNLMGVLVLFALVSVCTASPKIDFETSEGFTVGGVWPSGWSSSTTGGISTGYPSSGAQCLELLYMGSGVSSTVTYSPSLAVSTNQKTLIQFDIRPSAYNPPRYFNFSGYGGVYILDQNYSRIGGLIFDLQNYNTSSTLSD